jgi:hypothetical protein
MDRTTDTLRLENTSLQHPKIIKVLANFFSYIFHPLFMPTYVAAYIIFVHPYSFASFDEKTKTLRLISVIMMTFFFPALTVFLLWRLKFSNSIFLRTQKERIIPYVASIIYFFWAFYVSNNLPGTPSSLISFLLGIFLAVSASLMANSYFKISMHAVGVGGAMAFMIFLALVSNEPMGLYLAASTLVAGVVCTSRFIVSDHTQGEVYWGIIIGAFCQWVAYLIMM